MTADSPQSTSRTPYAVPEEPRASFASNILAIVGFIILIVVVIWGLVHLASISRSWFSSLFGGSGAAIEVSAPESATSGVPFTVSWTYDEPTEGTYAFLYQCQGRFQFQTPALSSNVMNGIPCGAAFTVSSKEKKVSVTPLLSSNTSLDVPISIIFMPSGTGTQAQGSATVKISPVSAPAPAPTPSTPTPVPAPTPTPQTPPSTSAPKTLADLFVRILSVSVDGSGQGTATFDIANVGGTSSGTYYFTAQLPTFGGYTYASPAQTLLAPGAHIVSTLRFSQGVSGVFSVSITTPDANQSNNYASQTMNASYSPYAPGYGGTQYDSYNYNYPYNYGTYPYTQTAGYSYSSYAPGYGGTQQYQAQYSSASYPYQYQTYPYTNQYTYPSNYYQYPNMYQQYPSSYAPGYGGTQYSQQYPYAVYYPYTY